ncbi:MAG: hypothetical protein OEY66_07115 [Gammaproteobacteria bacterium]|nr:hypothetical protein [Gammaproteobacteria bacterium]
MRDLHNNINPTGVAVTANTDNTATVSGIIDLQGYGSLEFLIATGTLADADATFTTLVEEGDVANLSDAAAVADGDLLGTEALASFTFAEDDSVFKIGYTGNKRYVRCTVTPAANTGAAPLAIIPVLGHPNIIPTDNPPA